MQMGAGMQVREEFSGCDECWDGESRFLEKSLNGLFLDVPGSPGYPFCLSLVEPRAIQD